MLFYLSFIMSSSESQTRSFSSWVKINKIPHNIIIGMHENHVRISMENNFTKHKYDSTYNPEAIQIITKAAEFELTPIQFYNLFDSFFRTPNGVIKLGFTVESHHNFDGIYIDIEWTFAEFGINKKFRISVQKSHQEMEKRIDDALVALCKRINKISKQ